MQRVSRYRSSMSDSHPNKYHEPAFPFVASAPLAVLLTLLAAITAMAAQTTTSEAAEIHDHQLSRGRNPRIGRAAVAR